MPRRDAFDDAFETWAACAAEPAANDLAWDWESSLEKAFTAL